MIITILSEDDYYAHLEKPHNPPSPSLSTEEFDQEYYSLFDKVEAIMSDFGENDDGGGGDYLLEPHITNSRGLGFEITNSAIVTEPLLQRLQGMVAMHAPAWELFLGSANYDFGVFIGSDSIRMRRIADNLLPQLDEFIVQT